MLALLVVLIAGIQFARPARTNPPEEFSKTIFADAAVWQDAPKTIERACLDCHSSRTRWPWYSNVAPVSWLVAGDVAEAREQMNLSNWAEYKPSRKLDLLEDVCKLVKRHAMPLPIYIPMHAEAKLTEQERQEICAWSERARERVAAAGK
jgi:uncharacterized membrane protein